MSITLLPTQTQAPFPMTLLAERAIHIAACNALVLSDVHLGKAMHFRQRGIAVPDGIAQRDLERMTALIQQTGADLYVVGDLVHAGHNAEWERFAQVSASWSVDKYLVLGNHDKEASDYARAIGMHVHEHLDLGGVELVHKADDTKSKGGLTICGHDHPSVVVGAGTQFSMHLPCFHLRTTATGSMLTLPAFGSFTGNKTLRRTKTDVVYAIADGEVIAVP